MMEAATFKKPCKVDFDGVPITYTDAKDAGYELTVVYKTTVAEKHRGTPADQHDMQILGRTQELRV